MSFWVGWALWQQMSLVLACLITIVLVYAFAVLAYNRRKTKKHAIAEAYLRAEEEAEASLRLTTCMTNDIPFGARALESGIEIEGIWISHNNTPVPSPPRPGTPFGSRPPSPMVPSPLAERCTNSAGRFEQPATHSRSSSLTNMSRPPGSPRVFHLNAIGADSMESSQEMFPPNHFVRLHGERTNQMHDFDTLRSGEVKPLEQTLKRPRFPGSYRNEMRSSEDFGRVMSRIFRDNVGSTSSEAIQLRTFPQYQTRYDRDQH